MEGQVTLLDEKFIVNKGQGMRNEQENALVNKTVLHDKTNTILRWRMKMYHSNFDVIKKEEMVKRKGVAIDPTCIHAGRLASACNLMHLKWEMT